MTLGSDGLGGLDWMKESEVRSENESEEEETYLELLGQVKVVREVLLAKRSLQQTTKAACQSGERARTDRERERERERETDGLEFSLTWPGTTLASTGTVISIFSFLSLSPEMYLGRRRARSEARIDSKEEEETYLKSRMKASDPALSIFLPVTVVAVQ